MTDKQRKGQPSNTFHLTNKTIEIGVDESGAGSLIGSVFAGAVVWDPEITSPIVRDSKTLSHRQHLIAYDFIRENCIAWGVGIVERDEIDKINILNARIKAMHLAVDDSGIVPQHIMVDGDRFKIYTDRDHNDISYTTVKEGDSKYYSIAAAGIVAKVNRDEYINKLCDEHEVLELYNIRSNKGYAGCQKHQDGLANWGATEWHRRSFNCGRKKN